MQTNLVYFDLTPDALLSGSEVVTRLQDRGVLVGYASDRGFRAVTHCWIDDAGIQAALAALREVMER